LERSLVLLRQTQWLQQKALSRALHGPVQMAVTAAAIRLEDSLLDQRAPVPDIEAIRDTLIDALDALTVESDSVTSLLQVGQRLSATWEGICTIDLHANAQIEFLVREQPALRACLVDIVSEAVTNAIRHSGASTASITMRVADPELPVLHVEVESNGRYAGEGERGGLGSRLLDECTLSWSRTPTAQGQLLTAEFPVT
jgi:signal transduction histidine kinase